MTTTAKPASAAIEQLGQKHARVLELLGLRISAQATIRDILDTACEKELGHLLKCGDSLQAAIAQNAEAEKELEALARELIPDDAEERSIKTPLGTVNLRRTTALVSPEDGGDEAIIALIEDWASGEMSKRHGAAFAEVGVVDPAVDFLRIEKKLNREALERLPDVALNVLRLKRVTTMKFTIGDKKLTAAQAQALINTAKAKAEKASAS